MSQVSGAFTVELDMERLAAAIAVRVVELLRAGSDRYERPADPDPGAGGRSGARFGGVTDAGVDYDDRAG